MRLRYVLVAGILGAASAGCGEEFLSNGLRNFIVSPCQATDERVLECRSAHWAEEAWQQLRQENAAQKYSLDFKEGFKSGFVSYVTRGGNGNPPAVPPIRYQQFGEVTVPGERNEKALEWFAGYRVGAVQAQRSGYREDVVIAVSSPPADAIDHRPTLAENAAANPLTLASPPILPPPLAPRPMAPPPDVAPSPDTSGPRPGPTQIPPTLQALPPSPPPRPIGPAADKKETPASPTDPKPGRLLAPLVLLTPAPKPALLPMSQAPGGQTTASAAVGAAAADGAACPTGRRATPPLSRCASQGLPLPPGPDAKSLSSMTGPYPGPKPIPSIVPPLVPTAPPQATVPASDSKVTPASYSELRPAPSASPTPPPVPALLPGGQAPDRQVTAAADGPVCATGVCSPGCGCPKTCFTLEKPPCIQYKTICSKPVCSPCDLVGNGYFPTCWRQWPFLLNCKYCPVPPPGALVSQPRPPEVGNEELPPPKIYSPGQ